MDSAYLPYLVTEIFCIAYTATIYIHLRLDMGNAREFAILQRMIIAYIVMLATDMLWIFAENGMFSTWRALNAIANGCSLTAVVFGCYFWCRFIETRLHPQTVPTQKAERLLRLPLYGVSVLDLSSMLTGWVFYISSDGLYTLGKLFWVQAGVTFAYLLVPTLHCLLQAVRTPSRKKRREYLTYVVYMCVCFVAVWVGDAMPTIPLFALCIFAVIQSLFLTLYLDQEYALTKKERELTESRTAVMLSQIQPHFLYNTLVVIQAMCQEHSPEAAQTTVEFADFLRENIDSLGRKEPIPFERELRHTQNYLALEKKRCGDRLKVVYDIQTEGFFLPALTLQPIVENAVRHGVWEREEGGTVRIATVETEHFYNVTVEDDGVGFQPDWRRDDGRSHIGISNVRDRLRVMCDGTLTVTGKPGEGTVAVISVPKKTGL